MLRNTIKLIKNTVKLTVGTSVDVLSYTVESANSIIDNKGKVGKTMLNTSKLIGGATIGLAASVTAEIASSLQEEGDTPVKASDIINNTELYLTELSTKDVRVLEVAKQSGDSLQDLFAE